MVMGEVAWNWLQSTQAPSLEDSDGWPLPLAAEEPGSEPPGTTTGRNAWPHCGAGVDSWSCLLVPYRCTRPRKVLYTGA